MERIQAAAAEIAKKTRGSTVGIEADLTRDDHLIAVVRQTEAMYGPIDILVLNTGNPPSGRFSEVSDEDWARGLSLCLRAPIILSRQILPGMRARKFGRIIFLSSIFAKEPDERYVVSSTLRAGLGALAKCLAREVGGDGVCVNVICAGYFQTPLLEEQADQQSAIRGRTAKELLSEWAQLAPVNHLGNPCDLGKLVAFLASPATGFLQGTSIALDGGALHVS
jgi:3-oxoacyl-[acyl-carrier protein] reductase